MTDTATVETLTAEVRVLMVGNRQITLSVYRQLDDFEYLGEPDLSQFNVFGRVRTGTKYVIDIEHDYYGKNVVTKGEAWAEFVGRDERTRALTRLVVLTYQDLGLVPDLKETLLKWKYELPLIVLAGLR